jgi:hypothetical protein
VSNRLLWPKCRRGVPLHPPHEPPDRPDPTPNGTIRSLVTLGGTADVFSDIHQGREQGGYVVVGTAGQLKQFLIEEEGRAAMTFLRQVFYS